MADTFQKLKLRPVNAANGDKTPSPATKLLINHGKPNFTIQRSPKAQQNGDGNPLNTEIQNQQNNNNNYYAYKSATVKVGTPNNNTNKDFVVQSTKFNGVFKPSNISASSGSENEEPFVVLRRPKVIQPPPKENGEEDVPEFILRQRRIQERLAKENLDFENRRSGYFTQVVMSPTSTERKSYAETMSSPAVVPSLEMPTPAKSEREETIAEEEVKVEVEKVENQEETKETKEVQQDETKVVQAEEPKVEVQQTEVEEVKMAEPKEVKQEEPKVEAPQVEEQHIEAQARFINGQVEEDEVAKAIEEVNKAVAGEVDDDKISEQEITPVVTIIEHVEQEQKEQEQQPSAEIAAVVTSAILDENEKQDVASEKPAVVNEKHEEVAAQPKEELAAAVLQATEETKPTVELEQPKENGHDCVTNGHSVDAAANDVTISHTNGVGNGPSIPTPDPSGALGVNYEPKTVVSFSKDLGSEPNKYPDTVKVLKEGDNKMAANNDMQEFSKLKFDIKADEQDVQVTSVLKTE